MEARGWRVYFACAALLVTVMAVDVAEKACTWTEPEDFYFMRFKECIVDEGNPMQYSTYPVFYYDTPWSWGKWAKGKCCYTKKKRDGAVCDRSDILSHKSQKPIQSSNENRINSDMQDTREYSAYSKYDILKRPPIAMKISGDYKCLSNNCKIFCCQSRVDKSRCRSCHKQDGTCDRCEEGYNPSDGCNSCMTSTHYRNYDTCNPRKQASITCSRDEQCKSGTCRKRCCQIHLSDHPSMSRCAECSYTNGQCRKCQTGYDGLTCENCASGYYEEGQLCKENKMAGASCSVSSHCGSQQCRGQQSRFCCHPNVVVDGAAACTSCSNDNGICTSCGIGYTGDHCSKCAEGFVEISPGRCTVKKPAGGICNSDDECTMHICLGSRCCASAGETPLSCASCDHTGSCLKCLTGYEKVGGVCAKECPGGATSRIRYKYDSLAGSSSCRAVGNHETQTRFCNAGEWSEWSGSFIHIDCLSGCGDFHVGDTRTLTRFQDSFVRPGHFCTEQLQEHICTASMIWSTPTVVSTNGSQGGGIIHNKTSCYVQCAPGCDRKFLLDNVCQDECNFGDCRFDAGACAAEAALHISEAQFVAMISGISTDDTTFSAFADVCEGGGGSADIDSFGGHGTFRDAVQVQVAASACLTMQRLTAGQSYFGTETNYVFPLVPSEYEKLILPLILELSLLENEESAQMQKEDDAANFELVRRKMALLSLKSDQIQGQMQDLSQDTSSGLEQLNDIVSDLGDNQRIQYETIMTGINQNLAAGKQLDLTIQTGFSDLDAKDQTRMAELSKNMKNSFSDLGQQLDNVHESLKDGQGKLSDQVHGVNDRLVKMEKTLAEIQKTVVENHRMLQSMANQFYQKKDTLDELAAEAPEAFDKFLGGESSQGWDSNGDGTTSAGELAILIDDYDLFKPVAKIAMDAFFSINGGRRLLQSGGGVTLEQLKQQIESSFETADYVIQTLGFQTAAGGAGKWDTDDDGLISDAELLLGFSEGGFVLPDAFEILENFKEQLDQGTVAWKDTLAASGSAIARVVEKTGGKFGLSAVQSVVDDTTGIMVAFQATANAAIETAEKCGGIFSGIMSVIGGIVTMNPAAIVGGFVQTIDSISNCIDSVLDLVNSVTKLFGAVKLELVSLKRSVASGIAGIMNWVTRVGSDKGMATEALIEIKKAFVTIKGSFSTDDLELAADRSVAFYELHSVNHSDGVGTGFSPLEVSSDMNATSIGPTIAAALKASSLIMPVEMQERYLRRAIFSPDLNDDAYTIEVANGSMLTNDTLTDTEKHAMVSTLMSGLKVQDSIVVATASSVDVVWRAQCSGSLANLVQQSIASVEHLDMARTMQHVKVLHRLRRVDVEYRLQQQLFRFRSQIAYMMLKETDDMQVQMLHDKPTPSTYTELYNKLCREYQRFKEESASEAKNKAWMQIAVDRSDYPAQFAKMSVKKRFASDDGSNYGDERVQLEFELPTPEGPLQYSHVTLLAARAYVEPLNTIAEYANIQLTKGPYSVFTKHDGVVRQTYSHNEKQFAFRYYTEDCHRVGEPVDLDTALHYSPFGHWKLDVTQLQQSLEDGNTDYDTAMTLNEVDRIIFEFEVEYSQSQAWFGKDFPFAPRCSSGTRSAGTCEDAQTCAALLPIQPNRTETPSTENLGSEGERVLTDEQSKFQELDSVDTAWAVPAFAVFFTLFVLALAVLVSRFWVLRRRKKAKGLAHERRIVETELGEETPNTHHVSHTPGEPRVSTLVLHSGLALALEQRPA